MCAVLFKINNEIYSKCSINITFLINVKHSDQEPNPKTFDVDFKMQKWNVSRWNWFRIDFATSVCTKSYSLTAIRKVVSNAKRNSPPNKHQSNWLSYCGSLKNETNSYNLAVNFPTLSCSLLSVTLTEWHSSHYSLLCHIDELSIDSFRARSALRCDNADHK